MAYRKHPRRITDEQFADGTTIDGSRIDSAMEDVVEHVNNIPKGDLGRRFVQTQYVAGWQPYSSENTFTVADWDRHHMPWLPVINYPTGDPALPASAVVAGSVVGSQPDDIRNRHRFKGIAVPGIDYDITGSNVVTFDNNAITGLQWAWSRSFHFSSPVVLRDVAIHMHTDRSSARYEPYQNSFIYSNSATPASATPPPGFAQGDGAHDLCVLMDVAHPFTPEDTRMRSVVFLKRGFNVPNSAISRLAMGPLSSTAPTYADMHPTFRGGPLNAASETIGGILIRESGLDIPIPAGSRARLAVIIPQYQRTVVESQWGDYDASKDVYQRPWSTQSYSATLTVLEEVFSV